MQTEEGYLLKPNCQSVSLCVSYSASTKIHEKPPNVSRGWQKPTRKWEDKCCSWPVGSLLLTRHLLGEEETLFEKIELFPQEEEQSDFWGIHVVSILPQGKKKFLATVGRVFYEGPMFEDVSFYVHPWGRSPIE